jgi:hypothetical protein
MVSSVVAKKAKGPITHAELLITGPRITVHRSPFRFSSALILMASKENST